jgi:hypothetical protein
VRASCGGQKRQGESLEQERLARLAVGRAQAVEDRPAETLAKWLCSTSRGRGRAG